MYKTWIDEWGFTPEAVQEACRETTKGTPTMAYLNGILMRQHQLGRHEVIALETGMQTEHEARNFAREVYAGLGVTGKRRHRTIWPRLRRGMSKAQTTN